MTHPSRQLRTYRTRLQITLVIVFVLFPWPLGNVPAYAAEDGEAAGGQATEATTEPSDSADAAAKDAAGTAEESIEEAAQNAADADEFGEEGVPQCPKAMDEVELKLLKGLRARRLDLDAREIRLKRREELVAKIERDLGRRVREALSEVERLEQRLELGEYEEKARESKLNSLAASIASLSPRKAAPILERVDPVLTAILLLKVGPERTGELLAKMEPRKAASLMDRLAKGQSAAQLAAMLVRAPRRGGRKR